MKTKEISGKVFVAVIVLLTAITAFSQTKSQKEEKIITVDLNKQIVLNQPRSENSTIKINIASVFDSVRKIGNFEEQNIRLELSVKKPDDSIEGFRVFLDRAGADSSTPIDTAEYVGAASFYGGLPGEDMVFLFDLEKFKSPFSPKDTSCEDDQKLILSIVPLKRSDSKNADSELIVKDVSFTVSQ